jgi:stage IV sporulation protein FB
VSRWSLNFRFASYPTSIHFSFFLGALLFSRFQFRVGLWAAFAFLILVHELGHAWLVRRYKLRVTHVMLHGIGGECAYVGNPTPYQSAVIAWGGVWAQGVVLCLALLVSVALPGHLLNLVDGDFLQCLLWPNLQLMAINLLPIAPLDGSRAWLLLPMLGRRVRRQHLAQKERAGAERARVTLAKVVDADDCAVTDAAEAEIAEVLKRNIERGARKASKTDL